MALIIYPATNADSFISVTDADTVIANYTLQYTAWSALSTSDKEAYLRIAYRFIIDNTDGELYEDPIQDCVPQAQALMAAHDMTLGISTGVSPETKGALRKQKVGDIQQEWYDVDTKLTATGRVPPLAATCLEAIGYSYTASAGVTQTVLGRS